MWQQFYFENFHFALYLFVSLVLGSVFWLYLDSWKEKKLNGNFYCLVGFLILSISFFIRSTHIESVILANSFFEKYIFAELYLVLRNIGYVLVLVGVLADKFQKKPQYAAQFVLGVSQTAVSMPILYYLSPVLAFCVAIIYLLKAIVGLEKHLLPIAISFFILCIHEIFGLRSVFINTQNVDIYNLVAAYGPVWIAEHVSLAIFAIVLAKWVFGYLLKQFEPQMFMILSSLILSMFLVITVAFTGMLIKNIETQNLNELASDVAILDLSIDAKKTEAVSDAQVVAENTGVVEALINDDKTKLADLAEQFILEKRQDTLMIVNQDGVVVARGEDREKTGDAITSSRLVQGALRGELLATIISKDALIAPVITISAASPIKENEKIIGAVVLGTNIDNEFAAGIKDVTNFDVSLYSDNKISSTSLLALDNKSPLVGIVEENEKIKRIVLQQAQKYQTEVVIGGKSYLAAYSPLLDVDNISVGMIFVGRPQIEVLQTAGKSIEYTFLITAALLVISILPSLLIARYITKQLR